MKKILLFTALIWFSGCQTNYYIVRHAEKATEPRQDPPLTEVGQQRATRLKEIMLSKNIEKVFSTNYVRTKSTAIPTADALGLPVELYDPANQASFVNYLKSSRRNTLIVGHSNTIREVINGLYGSDTLRQDLNESEYSNLYTVTRKYFPSKKQTFTKNTF